MFDQNGSGAIEPAELLEIFKNNPLFDINTAKQILSELDLDHDGKIKFSEFLRFMRDGESCVCAHDDGSVKHDHFGENHGFDTEVGNGQRITKQNSTLGYLDLNSKENLEGNQPDILMNFDDNNLENTRRWSLHWVLRISS